VAAIAMTVNAYKTRALFDGKIGEDEVKSPATDKEAPEPAPGKT
jgi:hypothetical protein